MSEKGTRVVNRRSHEDRPMVDPLQVTPTLTASELAVTRTILNGILRTRLVPCTSGLDGETALSDLSTERYYTLKRLNYLLQNISRKILSRIFINLIIRKLTPYNRLGDKLICLYDFYVSHGRIPTNTLIFNDVLYKIKATDEIIKPLRVFVTDKEFVKLFVKAVVGDQYNVPTITVLNSMDEVRNYPFPPECCIKPTHGCGQVIFRKNGEGIDFKKIERWFEMNHYRKHREANYKTLQPKIIVEPFIFGTPHPNDYKFFCYKGSPKLIKVIADRHTHYSCKYFDDLWVEQDFSITHEKSSRPMHCPSNLKEMLSIAAALSAHFSFVRVDLYSNGDQCLVGEITNCSERAGGQFIPQSGEQVASNIIFG